MGSSSSPSLRRPLATDGSPRKTKEFSSRRLSIVSLMSSVCSGREASPIPVRTYSPETNSSAGNINVVARRPLLNLASSPRSLTISDDRVAPSCLPPGSVNSKFASRPLPSTITSSDTLPSDTSARINGSCERSSFKIVLRKATL